MRRSKKRKEYGDEGAGGWREDGEKVREGSGGKGRSGENGGRGRRRKVLETFGNNGGVVERKMYKSGGDD